MRRGAQTLMGYASGAAGGGSALTVCSSLRLSAGKKTLSAVARGGSPCQSSQTELSSNTAFPATTSVKHRDSRVLRSSSLRLRVECKYSGVEAGTKAVQRAGGSLLLSSFGRQSWGGWLGQRTAESGLGGAVERLE